MEERLPHSQTTPDERGAGNPCKAISQRSGKPCKWRAREGQDYCKLHGAGEKLWLAKGAARTNEVRREKLLGTSPVNLKTSASILSLLEEAAELVRRANLPPGQRAIALNKIAATALRARSAVLEEREVAKL